MEELEWMANAKSLPEPHRYAVCAYEDMPIKEFYEGVFEDVFIFYHPFIKPRTIGYERFMPDTYPTRMEIMEHCEAVTWENVLKLTGIPDAAQLDIGLRSLIYGLKKEFANDETAKIIANICEQEKIVCPTEGLFPEIIMAGLLESIKNLGHDWIWCGDEFCTERKLEYTEDLIKDLDLLHRERRNLFTHDQSILITTHWDSHFSMLCSDKATLKKIVEECQLEGFYCNDHTEIYWSLSN